MREKGVSEDKSEGSAAGRLLSEPPTSGIEKLPSRLERYAKARRRSESMGAFLRGFQSGSLSEVQEAAKASQKLCACGQLLHFRHYFTVDELRLVGGEFCQQPKLCPLCAIRRASKTLARYLERFKLLMWNAPVDHGCELQPYLITLTVKNGSDLTERIAHLKTAWRRLVARRRQALSGNGRGITVFRNVVAAVGSFEVTNRGRGWHPHMHLIALCDSKIDPAQLGREWQISTKDSFIVDVREIAHQDNEKTVQAFCEVFKYSMKFQDLSLADNWSAHRQLKGQRLTVSIGGFYGIPEVSVEDSCTDLEELPYVDLFFRYLSDSAVYTLDRERTERTDVVNNMRSNLGADGIAAASKPEGVAAALPETLRAK